MTIVLYINLLPVADMPNYRHYLPPLIFEHKILTEVKTAQSVSTLPFLLMSGHFAIVHNERHPATKHIHLITNHSGGVKTPR